MTRLAAEELHNWSLEKLVREASQEAFFARLAWENGDDEGAEEHRANEALILKAMRERI